MTRMSCNGCRVLRKGCSDGCTIRPCLEWIKSPEAQANATVFLAKFYGRAGLLNLLAAGSDASLRPALFRSLLYEACGRMANPTYGSVGLLWSGQWEACQAAVEAVLKGTRVVQVPSEAVAAAQAAPPLGLRAYDIRHVSTKGTAEPLRVSRAARTRFKRASSSTSIRSKSSGAERVSTVQGLAETERVAVGEYDDDLDRGPSHEESAGSHDHRGHVDDDDDDDMAVEQTREESENTEIEAGSHVSQAEQSPFPPMRQVAAQDDAEIELELTLGFEPVTRVVRSAPARFDVGSLSAESSHIGLRLELSA